MNMLKQNWKAIAGFLLAAAAVCVYSFAYHPARQEFQRREAELNTTIASLQDAIAENLRCSDIQNELEDAAAELEDSRLALYRKFPSELKEEDLIMYVVYLEDVLGTELHASFGTTQPLLTLSDGASLYGVTLTLHYRTNYAGFQNMVSRLVSDEHITSIQNATLEYDAANDEATGTLTLLCYVIDSGLLAYTQPDVAAPATGKSNIFG